MPSYKTSTGRPIYKASSGKPAAACDCCETTNDCAAIASSSAGCVCFCIKEGSIFTVSSWPPFMQLSAAAGNPLHIPADIQAHADFDPWPPAPLACGYAWSGPDILGEDGNIWAILYVANRLGSLWDFTQSFWWLPLGSTNGVLDPGSNGDHLSHTDTRGGEARAYNAVMAGGSIWITGWTEQLDNRNYGGAFTTNVYTHTFPRSFSDQLIAYSITGWEGCCTVDEYEQTWTAGTGEWGTGEWSYQKVGTRCIRSADLGLFWSGWRKKTCACSGDPSQCFKCCYRTFTWSCDPKVLPPAPTPLSGSPPECTIPKYKIVHTYIATLTCNSNTHFSVSHSQALVPIASAPEDAQRWTQTGAGSTQWVWRHVLPGIYNCNSTIVADPSAPSTPTSPPNGEVFVGAYTYLQTFTCPSTWGSMTTQTPTSVCVQQVNGLPASDTDWRLSGTGSGTRTYIWVNYVDVFSINWSNPLAGQDPNAPTARSGDPPGDAGCCPSDAKQVVLTNASNATGTYRLTSSSAEVWTWDGASGPGSPYDGSVYPRTIAASITTSGSSWLLSVTIKACSICTNCTVTFVAPRSGGCPGGGLTWTLNSATPGSACNAAGISAAVTDTA